MLRRRVLVLAPVLASALVLVLAGPAWAHVTIDPAEAPQGGFATVSFRVPNERDDSATTMLEVEFPTDSPISSARVKPVPGWTATVETAPAPGGGEGGAGEAAEVVTRITWTGGAVQPGQFEEFPVSMGPLPDDTDELVFPTIQTYASGEVVRWIDETTPGGEEPEHPAPVLTLTAEGDDGAATDDSDDSAATGAADDGDDDGNTLAVVALVVGALGLLTGIGALVQGRRRATS